MARIIILAAIVAGATALLLVTVTMEWIGVMNLFTRNRTARYSECGHLRGNPASMSDSCWACRHKALGHLHLTHSH